MTEENVKVAVRIRPFNSREKGRNAQLILDVNKNTTFIRDPAPGGETKSFTFDYSYWSFDGSKDVNGYFQPDTSHKNGSKFADQKKVFNDLGQGILKNAWGGYNATLFAYGQTGSGKSYSVIGYGPNKGIVPTFCEEIFKGIKEKAKQPVQFEVKFSMLEIYSEVVHDLLNPNKAKKGGLKVRQHPKKGFYAEGLKQVMVTSYEEIETQMDQGTMNRTVASTNMNATSSRAHTIVGIHFTQKQKNAAGQETAKTSIVNLVDLAGSERADSTGARGERLKEGAAINKSLSCLGNCIFALTEIANGDKDARVPFRDSQLTRLLQNALMGNSKTVLVAALSPADLNYEETLSTLRFADRAKQIKTKATVNEDPTEKLLRELKEENERLKASMKGGKIDLGNTKGMSEADKNALRKEMEEELRAQMQENDREQEEMKKSYEEKLKAARQAAAAGGQAAINKDKETKPHIFNLNMDPMLSGRIVNVLKKKQTEVGNRKGGESDITMIGPGIQEKHAIVVLDEKANKVNIKPCNTECRVLVNGTPIQGETTLCHNDRLVFGGTQIWVFANPLEAKQSKKKYPSITYEYAQEEIASKNGLKMDNTGNTDQVALQEDLLELMPGVEEANSISEELDKRVKFEILLVSPQMMGKTTGRTEVCVKMRNLANNAEYVWPKDKFRNRLYLMQEMYGNFEDDDDWDLPESQDPFRESPDTEVLLGTCQVFLQPIAFQVELKDQLEIANYKGSEVGVMNIEVIPCAANGKEYKEEDDRFVDSPDMLIGKDVNFVVKLLNIRGLPNKYTDVFCKYKMYLEDEHATKHVPDTNNPDFNDAKVFKFPTATKQLVDYLHNSSMSIQVWGKHRLRNLSGSIKHLTTKDIMKTDRGVFSRTANLMNGFQMNGRVVDPQKQSIIVELLLMKKTQARLQQRVDGIRKLLQHADKMARHRVPVDLLKRAMDAQSPAQVDKCIRELEGK
ncbi:kinesin-like protein KIF28P isoform X2 [Pollicipes pollicipes]|uniref:kinesin-like protein KIF28P isoform X2 n=1 Tax=Pollicipes pollicipes TaxID=41117 RepID=UPI00188501A1|nr:kinesin-like protein KIF28P isoform X2 [Pollicipes pollicipes]